MKKMIFTFVLLTVICSWSVGQAKQPGKTRPEDQITQYWFVLIRTGPNTTADSATKATLFEKHMANINRLYYEGILKAAGPYGKNDKQWRGLFVLDCATREEAERHVMSDAAVAAGIFEVDIVPWYTAPMGSFKKGKPEKPAGEE